MNEHATNIKFVQEVEKHPCLYNTDLTDYSRRDVTEAAWNEVGETVNMTTAACKERWKNLRTVFVRHLKAYPTGKMKKKYYLTDFMQFLLPYLKVGNIASYSNLPDENIQEYSSADFPFQYESDENIIPEISDMEIPQLNTSQLSFNSGCKGKRKIMNDLDEKPLHEDERRHMAYDNDTRKMFLLSLLDEVREMSEEQMRLFKRRVLALIDDITSYRPQE